MTNILNLYNNNVQIKILMCFLEHFASTSPNMKRINLHQLNAHDNMKASCASALLKDMFRL